MLIGGDLLNESTTNKTWFYNHQTDELSLGPELMIGRGGHAAGIVKDKATHKEYVVVVGGLHLWPKKYYTLPLTVELLRLPEADKWMPGIQFRKNSM